MTSRIIYHDFRSANNSVPRIILTAPVLTKGRRLVNVADKVNNVLTAVCIFLCGTCSAVRLFILIILAIGG